MSSRTAHKDYMKKLAEQVYSDVPYPPRTIAIDPLLNDAASLIGRLRRELETIRQEALSVLDEQR